MELNLYNNSIIQKYKSSSQIARVLTENWFKTEMYCPCCLSEYIQAYPNNQKGYDFYCTKCNNNFQAKGSKQDYVKRILDGEYQTMRSIISSDTVPNFLCMHYSKEEWIVKNLFLIPKYFLSESCIEKRKPLSENARRAGWTGCNILLDEIPKYGKIFIIKQENIIEQYKVYEEFKKIEFLKNEKIPTRGWITDVLNCIEKINKQSFTLTDIYSFEKELAELHPDNKHIKDKIRQQLQILRDRKLVQFNTPGKYSLVK